MNHDSSDRMVVCCLLRWAIADEKAEECDQ